MISNSYSRMGMLGVAIIPVLYFAFYPSIRMWISVSRIELQSVPTSANANFQSKACIHYDGTYVVSMGLPREEDFDPFRVLGRGEYSQSGEYKVVTEGIEVPIDIRFADHSGIRLLDTENTYPVVTQIASTIVVRRLGDVNLEQGCYDALISVAPFHEDLNNRRVFVFMELEQASGFLGRWIHVVVIYSDAIAVWAIVVCRGLLLVLLTWILFVAIVRAKVLSNRKR